LLPEVAPALIAPADSPALPLELAPVPDFPDAPAFDRVCATGVAAVFALRSAWFCDEGLPCVPAPPLAAEALRE
jgi:hypothetical protein